MTAYAPDMAPDLEPKVVHWQPAHATGGGRAHLFTPTAVALGLVALGLVALGAAAVGALAFGRQDGGRLDGGRRDRARLDGGRFRVLDLGELDVDRLRLRRRPF